MGGGREKRAPVVCGSCGQRTDPPALTWSRQVELSGRVRWDCEHCTRDNLRSIEAKLDPEWW